MDTQTKPLPSTKPNTFLKIASYILCSLISLLLGGVLTYFLIQNDYIEFNKKADLEVSSENDDIEQEIKNPETDALIEEIISEETATAEGEEANSPINEPFLLTNTQFFYKIFLSPDWSLTNGVNEYISDINTKEADVMLDNNNIGDNNDIWISSRDKNTFPDEAKCLATETTGNTLVKSYNQTISGVTFKVEEYKDESFNAYWRKLKTWHSSKEQCLQIYVFDNLDQTNRTVLDEALETFVVFE